MQDDVCGEDEKKRREDGAGGGERERWFNQSALERLELRQQARPLRHEPWERAATGPAASLSHSQDDDGGQSHQCAQYERRGTWPQGSALTGDCLAGCDSAWRLLRLGGLIGVGEGPTMMLLRKHLDIRGWEAESGKAGDKSQWSCDSNSNPVRAVIVPGAKSAPCEGSCVRSARTVYPTAYLHQGSFLHAAAASSSRVQMMMAFPSQNQGGWMLTLFGRHKVQTTAVFKPAFGGWH